MEEDGEYFPSPGRLSGHITACILKRYLYLDGVLPTPSRPVGCPEPFWIVSDQMTTDIRTYVVPQDLNPNPLPPVTAPEAWSQYVESARERIFSQGVTREKAMVFIDWCCKLVARVDWPAARAVIPTGGPCPYRAILYTFAASMEEDVFKWVFEENRRRRLVLNHIFKPNIRRPFAPLQIMENSSNGASS